MYSFRISVGLICMTILSVMTAVTVAQTTEQFRIDHITSDAGLSQNSVYAIEQDWHGIMWFGTQVGLNSYDGYNFTLFSSKNVRDDRKIVSGHINVIFADPVSKTVWVGTENGISAIRYSKESKKYSVVDLNDTSAPREGIFAMGRTEKGVWACTRSRLYIISGSDSIRFSHESKFDGFDVLNGDSQFDGNKVFLGSTRGLRVYDVNKKTIRPINNDGSAVAATYYDSSAKQLIWSTEKTKVFFKSITDSTEQIRQIPFSNSDPGARVDFYNPTITSIVRAGDKILVGTDVLGVFQSINNDDFVSVLSRRFNTPNSLNSNLILSLYQSKDSVLWIGTHGRGINKVSGSKPVFSNLLSSVEEGLPINDVYSVTSVGDNLVYAGTDGNGLVTINVADDKIRLSRRNGTIENSSYVVRSIMRSGNDLLLGTNNGLYVQQQARSTELLNQQLCCKNTTITKIVRFGNYHLLGTEDKGLLVADHNYQIQDTIVFNNMKNQSVWDIKVDRTDSSLLIGTSHGLFRLNDLNGSSEKLYEFEVLSILSGIKNIWLGSNGHGLVAIPKNKNEPGMEFTTDTGFPDNVVYGVLMDLNGYLWLSTNNGICRFHPEEYTMDQYTVQDGLQDNEFNRGSYHISDNKQDLFFGGVNGLTKFTVRSRTELAELNAQLLIQLDDSLQLYPGLIKDTLRIAASKEHVDIRPVMLDYNDTKNNSYKYSINDTDEWINIGEQSIEIPSEVLELGINTVHIRYKSSRGIWKSVDLFIYKNQPYFSELLHKTSINEVVIVVVIILAFILVFVLASSARAQRLKSLQALINEVSRSDKPSEVAEITVNHLIKRGLFKYKAARVVNIDYISRSATIVFSKDWPDNKDKPLDHKIIGVEKSSEKQFKTTNRGVKVFINNEEIVDDGIIQISKSHFFIPLVKRAKQKQDNTESDSLIGWIELLNDSRIDFLIRPIRFKELLLYTDNCAQPYYRTLYSDQKQRIKEKIDIIDSMSPMKKGEKEHEKFANSLLLGLMHEIGARFVDMVLFDHENVEHDELFKTNTFSKEEDIPASFYSAEFRKELFLHNPELKRNPLSPNYFYNGDLGFQFNDVTINSILVVGLYYRNDPLGKLYFYSSNKHQFDDYRGKYVERHSNDFIDIYQKRKSNFHLQNIVSPFQVFANLNTSIINSITNYYSKAQVGIWQRKPNIQYNLPDTLILPDSTFELVQDGCSDERLWETLSGKKIEFKNISVVLNSSEYYEDNRYREIIKYAQDQNYDKISIYPFRIENMVYGFITILTQADEKALYDERAYINSLLNKVSITRLNSKLIEFISIITELFIDPNFEDVLRTIAINANDILQADIVGFAEYNPVEEKFSSKKVFGTNEHNSESSVKEEVNSNENKIFKSFTSEDYCYIENEDLYVERLISIQAKTEEERKFWRMQNINSMATIRLENNDVVVGVILIYFRSIQEFGPVLKRFIRDFGKIARIAFINAKEIEERQEVARNTQMLLGPMITGTVLNGMMHNSKTALQSVLDTFELYQLKFDHTDKNDLPYTVRQYQEILDETLGVLTTSIKQFENYWVKKAITKEHLPIHEVIKKAIPVVNSEIDKRRIDLQWDPSKYDNPIVLVNKSMITDVFINLLRNAYQATKKNKKGEIIIEISLISNGSRVSVKITDNGIGIPRSISELIFEPYRTFKTGGSGLGLAISREVLKMHQGEIVLNTVREESNKTSFSVILPIVKKP